MTEHAETLRKLASIGRNAANEAVWPESSFFNERADALEAGADALAKLSSPDYVVVKREALDHALLAARRSGLTNSHVEFEEARALLGLSDSEGT